MLIAFLADQATLDQHGPNQSDRSQPVAVSDACSELWTRGFIRKQLSRQFPFTHLHQSQSVIFHGPLVNPFCNIPKSKQIKSLQCIQNIKNSAQICLVIAFRTQSYMCKYILSPTVPFEAQPSLNPCHKLHPCNDRHRNTLPFHCKIIAIYLAPKLTSATPC